MRRAAKIDDNQKAIVKALRSIPGCSVRSLAAVGQGMPDIIVGLRGVNYLFEIKDGAKIPSARKLTPLEQQFFDTWGGQCAVVKNIDEAVELLTK